MFLINYLFEYIAGNKISNIWDKGNKKILHQISQLFSFVGQ